MTHTGRCRELEEIPRGRGEELHDGLLLERRRVRDVNDDRRASKDLGETIASQGIDPCVWRGRHRLMAVFTEPGDELCSDQPGTADDDVFHDRDPFSPL